MTKVSKGDLNVEVVHVKTKDEIKVLAESYNIMVRNLKEIIDTVKNTNRRHW